MRKRLSRLALLSAVACFGVLFLPACGGPGDIEEGWRSTFAEDDSDKDAAKPEDGGGDLVAVADPGNASGSGEGATADGQEKDELDLGDLESGRSGILLNSR